MAEIIEKEVDKLIINKLTREEYKELVERGAVQPDEIYLFPDVDATEDEIRELVELVNQLNETVENLSESNEQLIDAVQVINEIILGSSENIGLKEIIYGIDGGDGSDGLLGRVNNLEDRVTTIEDWITDRGSEGSDESRINEVEKRLDDVVNNITEIHNHITNAVMAKDVESSESSEEEFDGLIIYCGTSTDVIEEFEV